MNENDYFTPKYPTIGVEEKRKVVELVNSSILNAWTLEDFYDFILLFQRVIRRLEEHHE